MNSRKVIPIIALIFCGFLIAFWIVTENYLLLFVTFLPIIIIAAFEVVLKGSRSYATLIRTVALPLYVRHRMIAGFSMLLILGIIGLNIIAQADPTPLERILVCIILILGSVPTFIYIKRNELGIPFLPLFSVIYSIYYILPILLLEEYTLRFDIPYDSLEKALLLAGLGLLLLFLAFYKLPGGSIGKHLPRISIYWNPQKAKFWAIILGTFGLVLSYLFLIVDVPVPFVQIVLFLAQLSIIGIGILFILQLEGYLNKAGKALLWGIFLPLIFLIRLGTGALAQILLIIVFLSLTYWHFRRKIPWKTAIITVLLSIVLLNVRGDFRELTWGGTYSEKNPIEKSMIFAEMAFREWESFTEGAELAGRRTAHILYFAHIIELTPETVPYWMGKTYLTLLWMPIPRVLFPWKPEKTLGQEFGHRYGLLYPLDYTTSFNLPQLVEMYANFGVIGVIIGMFLVGIIYRAFYEMFCHPKAGEGGLLIGLFIFMGLSNIESDFSLVFGNVLYYVILLMIVNRLIKTKSRQQ